MIRRTPRPTTRYLVLDNRTAQDRTLTYAATGLLVHLLSMPDDWEVSVKALAGASIEGRDKIRNLLNELQAAGYAVRVEGRNDKGHREVDYDIYDRPVTAQDNLNLSTEASQPGPEKPSLDANPGTETQGRESRAGNPGPGNPTQQSNKEQSNQVQSNQKQSTQSLYEAEFMACWRLYPKRAGGNSRKEALKAFSSRRKQGYTFEQLLDGTERYATFCDLTGKTKTEYVKMAATFYGPNEHFLEAWTPPPPTTPPANDPLDLDSTDWGEDDDNPFRDSNRPGQERSQLAYETAHGDLPSLECQSERPERGGPSGAAEARQGAVSGGTGRGGPYY